MKNKPHDPTQVTVGWLQETARKAYEVIEDECSTLGEELLVLTIIQDFNHSKMTAVHHNAERSMTYDHTEHTPIYMFNGPISGQDLGQLLERLMHDGSNDPDCARCLGAASSDAPDVRVKSEHNPKSIKSTKPESNSKSQRSKKR